MSQLSLSIVNENRLLGTPCKGELAMKDDRRNRIDELKIIQRRKQFIQMLESKIIRHTNC